MLSISNADASILKEEDDKEEDHGDPAMVFIYVIVAEQCGRCSMRVKSTFPHSLQNACPVLATERGGSLPHTSYHKHGLRSAQGMHQLK